jgi:hypothetical protein
MATGSKRRAVRAVLPAALALAMAWAGARPAAQSVAEKQTVLNLQRALERLPYYGVFDFLAFSVDRGTVTLQGFAYQGNLKADAARAVKRVSGVDEVANNITLLPASQNDDRIRWTTFYGSIPTTSCRAMPPAAPCAPAMRPLT